MEIGLEVAEVYIRWDMVIFAVSFKKVQLLPS